MQTFSANYLFQIIISAPNAEFKKSQTQVQNKNINSGSKKNALLKTRSHM